MDMMPEEHNLRLILAQIALRKEDFLTFHEQFAIVQKNAQDQDKPMIMVVKARLLLEEEASEEALQVLEEARANYPEDIHLFLSMYMDVYLDLGREDELWQFTLSLVPKQGTETPKDICLFKQNLADQELAQYDYVYLVKGDFTQSNT